MNYSDYRIIIMQGASGSGKSTWAQSMVEDNSDSWTIVSRDSIRRQLLGKDGVEQYFKNGMDYNLEESITTMEHANIAKALASGLNVIIDNTNLRKKYVIEYAKIALDLGIKEEEVAILPLPVDVNTALNRVWIRGERMIRDDVIKKQIEIMNSNSWDIHDCFEDLRKNKYEKKKWFLTPFAVEPDRRSSGNCPLAVICDIDGTISNRAIIMDPFPHLRGFYDYPECSTDVCNPFVVEILKGLYDRGIKIIFVSGRKEECRKETDAFLHRVLGDIDYKLYMRNPEIDSHDGIDDHDDIVKYRIYNEYIRGQYDILGVFDDRKRVVALWETLELPVANLGKLNEEF